MANPMAYATQYTRTGKLNMQNRKPYRTASQQALAKNTATKGKNGGAFRSNAPVSYHAVPRARRDA